MFKKFKRSWLLSNKHYLLPLFIILVLLDGVLALSGVFIALFIFLFNIIRARLPIDPGGSWGAEAHIYKKTDDAELKLDLYRPEGNEWHNAVIVFAHGGGWISGTRNQQKNVSWCRFLASRGFTVASIDYRLAFTHTMDDIFEDFSDAVSFIKKESAVLGISSRNIILMGLSAGGHLALSYAACNSAGAKTEVMEGVRGVVAYYSPSDLRDLFSTEDKSLFARFGAGTAIKTLPRFDEEAYLRYSPISWFTEKMVPVMAVHGRRDEIVPYSSSVKMIKRLKELKVPCRFLVHKTGGHGFEVISKDYRTTKILEETVQFIKNLIGSES
jgi:acetyl esterase/lipase